MKSYFRRYFYFILSALTYILIHEGVHLLQAFKYGIYEGIRVNPLGIEVMIAEPLTISGIKLAMFSGLSSIVTISIGYFLFFSTNGILGLNKKPIEIYLYYVTLLFMLIDPLYLSILSFVVGGDINGITLGLNISYESIRILFFIIASINLYLVYKKLYPKYVIVA
ncbi:hypothetical protein [Serpentinicella alkaliphila]|uniref:Peptidase M50B-like protein n=1 Tax=Serpentinicella alkaliphila TaxID=1734049 RepID=A0A4R2T8S4_9FIRM|nr:hypothetical protein [Serpentinicella alkaliphila]QUH26565.1 hypothetical protein HZR23_13110 [Serpentinicella alkaliphila]TCP99050.1 hypothetical protein EDD79_103713 [Serpentinicella alkaliphila]